MSAQPKALFLADVIESDLKSAAHHDEAAAELRRLHAELERERMRLVACGVVALADTPDSAKHARQMHPDYESAACQDVARRVDECISLRAQRDALLEALKSTGLFLHHCWCDVQMNDYSFEKLNQQMAVVDAAIKAVEGESHAKSL